MTTTYTPSLSLPLQGLGDNSNAWGGILNTQAFSVLDDAIATIYTKSIAGTGTTILGAGEPGQNESKKRAYVFTGALTGNSTVLWEQNTSRFFTVTNNTTGNFNLTLGVNNGSGSPAGTTQNIPQGATRNFYSDGTNIKSTDLVLPSFIAGLTLSNDATSPNTVLDVATGSAVDSTNAVMMGLAAAATINMATNGAGGLDTGSVAANSWYAALLITGSSGTTVMATKETAGSAIAPTMPAGYAYYRYIGSFQTDGSAHIVPFLQLGQMFLRKTAMQDFYGVPPYPVPALVTLSVPLGLPIIPLENMQIANFQETYVYSVISGIGSRTTSYSNGIAVQYLDFNYQQVGAPGSQTENITGVVTDTSGRVYHGVQATTSATVALVNYGWIDPHVAAVY